MGLLPEEDHFSALLSSLGITKNTLVVVYDDVSCGCAARFVWTLCVFGHEKAVVLNGGLNFNFSLIVNCWESGNRKSLSCRMLSKVNHKPEI